LVPARRDLAGLPVRDVKDCQLDAKAAARLGELSRELRNLISEVSGRRRKAEQNAGLAASYLEVSTSRGKAWDQKEAGPTLVQILQGQEAPMRLLLVRLLARIDGQESSAALARRAVFDLDANVREAAVAALGNRPAKEYRAVLLDGLRHVWAPAAEHASDA